MGDEDGGGDAMKKLNPLEAMRFVTAVHVVAYYLFEPEEDGWLKNLISWGVCAPSFFFVLSGFVLAINYWEKKDNYSVKEFYMKRFARIYPAYFISLFLFAWRDPMEYVSTWAQLTKGMWHMLLVQTWYVDDVPYKAGKGDDPGWAISVLAFLYAVFPIILKTSVENFNSRKSKVLVILLLWPMNFVLWHILKEMNLFEFDFTLPLLHLPAFFIGVATGGLYMVDRPAYNSNLLLVLLNKFAFSALFCFLVGLCVSVRPSDKIEWMWKTGLVAPAQAFICYWLAHGSDVVIQFLKLRIFGILGGLSFGMYLFHYHIDMFVDDCEIDLWDFYVFCLAAICVIVRYMVEIPAAEWIMATYKGEAAGGGE